MHKISRCVLFIGITLGLFACAYMSTEKMLLIAKESRIISKDGDQSISFIVVIQNPSSSFTTPRDLNISLWYRTDLNAGMLGCDTKSSLPCNPPIRCNVNFLLPVSSLSPHMTTSVEVPITSNQWGCKCLQNHCEGQTVVSLMADKSKSIEPIEDWTISGAWGASGRGEFVDHKGLTVE